MKFERMSIRTQASAHGFFRGARQGSSELGGGAFPAEAPTSAAHTDLTGVFGGLS